MGVYNPHAPYVLGQEMVDIRNEDVTFSPAVNVVELGHTFTPTTARTLQDGRFYINQFPPAYIQGQVMMVSVYKTGTEDQSGPIRSVIIPCNAGAVSGSGITDSTTGSSPSAGNIPFLLSSPSDSAYISVDPTSSAGDKILDVYFAVNNFAQALNGKRIVKVELLQGISWESTNGGITSPNPPDLDVRSQTLAIQSTGAGVGNRTVSFGPLSSFLPSTLLNIGTPVGEISQAVPITVVSLGEVDHVWNTPITTLTAERMPWRFTELQRFEASAGFNRVAMEYNFGAATNFAGLFRLNYVALKVYFCEETRVAYGSALYAVNSTSASPTGIGAPYVLGTNILTMRDPATLSANPVLSAGQQYTVTVSSPDVGDLTGPIADPITLPASANQYPTLNALREIAGGPVTGVKVNLTQTVDQTFSQESTLVLPQLSLHTSAGPLPEVHVYGRQAVAQVYGSITATQTILDSAAGGSFSWPQVRFYARRFGSTTVPLSITGSTASGLFVPGVSGSNATTPDNAALDIVGDIDIRVDLTMPDWSLSFESVLSKWNQNGVNQRSYLLQVTDTGNLALDWSADGINLLQAFSTVPVPAADGSRLAIRVTMDVDNGAAGRTITFYTAPTAAGPFVQLGATVIQAGVTSIFSSTAILQISGHSGSVGPDVVPYLVHSAQVLNGIAGTQVANPDFSAQAPGTTTFTDAAGRVWTVNGTAVIVGGITGSTASITPAAFDALDEILDGWKQVDLRFASAPVMGSGFTPEFTWSAAGELAGSRWEVLGATAPALSGTPGNNFTLVPAPHQLSSATYGQPTQGASIELGWMPQYAPPVSAPGPDATSDAVVIFSQDMATVSGFGVTTTSQALSGVGLNCSAAPWYIPTSLSYNQVTWAATSSSVLASGFGFYELQRMDTLNTSWETIAELMQPTATSFNDFEARVGISTSYRIRAVNELLFAGPWSSTVTLTMASPGLSGSGMTSHSYSLIFTSNFRQDGSRNLAYALAFTTDTTEAFTFPEAGFTQFQFMYGRDFQTAFRPLERGGSVFSRTVLVQAAAIAAETQPDFTSLRDMAWDTLPYVCVRDQDGNRWYANVAVPQGRILNRRQLYMADLNITEVTDTSAITTVS